MGVERQTSPLSYYLTPRWLRPPTTSTSLMDGSSLGAIGQTNKAGPSKAIVWAEEPWASESTPLLESGLELKDTRPVRQSLLKGSNSLPRTGTSRWDRLHLPYYTEPEEWEYYDEAEEEEEEEEDPDSRRGMLTALVAVIIFVAVGALSFGAHFQLSDPEVPIFPPRHYIHTTGYPHTSNRAVLVEAQTGAIATENEVCSNIGIETLKQGGNAADAAVSSTLCIGVVNMFSSGIGGGGFLIIRIPPNSSNVSSEVYSIDFREVAPEGSNATMFKRPFSSMFGGLSVGVPGEIKGLGEMHRRWGKLSWKQVVEPSAKLARGWKIGPELDRRIQVRSDPDLWPGFLT